MEKCASRDKTGVTMRKNYPAFSDAQSRVYSAFRFVPAMSFLPSKIRHIDWQRCWEFHTCSILHSRRVLDRNEREKMRREKTRGKKWNIRDMPRGEFILWIASTAKIYQTAMKLSTNLSYNWQWVQYRKISSIVLWILKFNIRLWTS